MASKRFKQQSNQSNTRQRRASRLVHDDDSSDLGDEKQGLPLFKKVPLRRSESFPNLSANFAEGYAFWLYYLCIIFICWYALFLFPIFQIWPALTMINIAHGAVTFYLMHWRRGTPDAFDAGRDEAYTFWEMFDGGKQFTPGRKFFTVVPIALFLIACYECEWRKRYYFFNALACGMTVVPKMPFMMGIRLFGVNTSVQ